MDATVTEAVLEADGDVLVVRWSLLGDERDAGERTGSGASARSGPARSALSTGAATADRLRDLGVDIAVGSSPDAVDHVHTLTVGPGLRAARLYGLGTGRHYVSVAPHGGGGGVVAGERRLPFDGVTNFRDLGGYPTTDGRRTRWGRVFRSDALHRFTPADRQRYQSLGLNAVYDLRGDVERERYPNPFPSVQLALLSRDASEAATPPERADRQDAGGGERMLREMYQGLLANAAAVFGRLLGALAEPAGLPAVFHCAGGKDRTGLTAALLLELLGVPRHLVLDDYELTSRYRLRQHQTESYENLLALGMGPEAAGAVLGTPRWAMAETLEELDTAYGGAEAYLAGSAGMSAAAVGRLQVLLVG
jgi:protein-tyrosine phosphatase